MSNKKVLIVFKENKILVGVFSSKKRLSKALGIKKSKLDDYCLHNRLDIHKVSINHLSMINLCNYIRYYIKAE